MGPIGPRFGVGNIGFNRPGTNDSYTVPPFRKPIASQFVSGAWRFDTDKNERLNQDELEKLAVAVVAELKRTPAVYGKLQRGAQGTNKTGKPVSDKKVTEAFLKHCLTFDRDKDGALNPHETDVLAAALVRFLQ